METSYEDDSGIELLDREVEDTSVTDKCRPIEVIEADDNDQGEKSEKSPEKHNSVSPMKKTQLEPTPVLKDNSQVEPRRIQYPDVLIFYETLIKHIGSKVEKGKNRLKWNGTLTDFKDFVSLVLDEKGKWSSRAQAGYNVFTFEHEEKSFPLFSGLPAKFLLYRVGEIQR